MSDDKAFAAIVRRVLENHPEYTIHDVQGEGKRLALAKVRHEITYTVRNELGWGWRAIGKALHRNHTSVIHGYRFHEAALRGEVYRQPGNRERARENYHRCKGEGKVNRFQGTWTADEEAELIRAAEEKLTGEQAAERLGRTKRECYNRIYHLRKLGRTTATFGGSLNQWQATTEWTPERDAKLIRLAELNKNSIVAGAKLGVSAKAAANRLARLRKMGKTNAMFPGSPRERKQRLLDRLANKPVAPVDNRPVAPPSFLDLLRQYERPPANIAVRDRQPLMRNPSLYVGGSGASSISMD